MKAEAIEIKAPGRLCLMGEHQDYLGLEVISGALNLHVVIRAEPDTGQYFSIRLLNTGEERKIRLDSARETLNSRDYLQSGFNLLVNRGFRFPIGYKITIGGDLPIGKGVSSSSALSVAWIAFLSHVSGNSLIASPLKIAELAFETEVINFGEPGGMQDHLASALGGLLHLDFRDGRDRPQVSRLPIIDTGFLLVDSGTQKETIGMIRSIRNDVESAMSVVQRLPGVTANLGNLRLGQIPASKSTDTDFKRLKGTLINRNITRYAHRYLGSVCYFEPHRIGRLMTTHHRILSRLIGSSTERLDDLCDLALQAGALGAKVIGSGGGGCILVYAPHDPGNVIEILSDRDCRITHVAFTRGVTLRTYPCSR